MLASIPLKSKLVPNFQVVYEKIKVEEKEDAEMYVRNKLVKMGIEVVKSRYVNGIPDFTCKYKGLKFYVEVKCNEDGLRYSQVRWIADHPKAIVYVYYLNQDDRREYEKHL